MHESVLTSDSEILSSIVNTRELRIDGQPVTKVLLTDERTLIGQLLWM